MATDQDIPAAAPRSAPSAGAGPSGPYASAPPWSNAYATGPAAASFPSRSAAPPRRRRKRRVLLPMAAVVVLGALGYAVPDEDDRPAPTRTPETGVTESASLSPLDLQPGDCYTDAPLPREDSAVTIHSVEAVPCPEPHTAQVVALLGYAGRSHAEAVDTLSVQDCEREFRARLTADVLGDERYVLGRIYPDANAWERTQGVVCVVATEAPTTGSVLQ